MTARELSALLLTLPSPDAQVLLCAPGGDYELNPTGPYATLEDRFAAESEFEVRAVLLRRIPFVELQAVGEARKAES
jgi:hypothetical protein